MPRLAILAALLVLAACGSPSATAVPTPAPTATRAPTATLTGLQSTATAVGVRQQATSAAIHQAACQTIAARYTEQGRVFDPAEAARNPDLADVDLHIVLFGTTAPIKSNFGLQREAQYRALLATCIGR